MVWEIGYTRRVGRWIELGMAIALSLAPAGNTWSEDHSPSGPKVGVIASSVEAPWAVAFVVGDDRFLTERPGPRRTPDPADKHILRAWP